MMGLKWYKVSDDKMIADGRLKYFIRKLDKFSIEFGLDKEYVKSQDEAIKTAIRLEKRYGSY